ncbi:MAG TPA: hypothetical protein VNZ43_15755 [Sphingomonadaceae bacterium]|nr:hypothetical protein [Sphingomonadaceae bacterium]
MSRILGFAAAVALVFAGGAASAASPARLGGKPNLNGIWQTMNSANWNLEPHDAGPSLVAPEQLGAIGASPPGLGVVEGGSIPYKPEALAQRDKNRKSAPKADPEAACYLPGIPRANYMSYPFQIVQGDNGDILVAYEYASANRVIHMQKVEVPPIDTWMGTSYGEWDGDTLKVVTLAQNGMTWLDRSGNYLSPTATVTERFTLKDPDHILYEATIDDPALYTKPWKISMPLYRRTEPNAQLLDFRCVPFSETLLYGDLLKDKDKYPRK